MEAVWNRYMAHYANQHFVPQFYFKRFSEGRNSINLVLTASGRIILNASIRHQCAGHNFYGSTKIERLLNEIEGAHSTALRVITDAAWQANWFALTPRILYSLWQAVLIQRSRTALQIEKSKDIPTALGLPGFRNHLATAPGIQNRMRMLEAIDRGQVRIVKTPESALRESISFAIESALLISDLEFCVLRNHTDYPFVFSDSPVVLYNTLLRDVTSRGVLGLQSPGLQIFYPLEADMLLMMYDEAAYKISHQGSVDLTERSDVSQLNALQLHHSQNAVYFGDPSTQEYIADLWQAHAQNVRRPIIETRMLQNVLIDGEAEENPVIQMLEPHLNMSLQLSFVTCDPVQDSDYHFRHRSPDLMAEYRARTKQVQSE